MEAPSFEAQCAAIDKKYNSTLTVGHSHGIFMNDVLKMINNPDFSDVSFVCKYGKKVHACRMLLAARSEFFQKLLTNGMAESKMKEIPLRHVEDQTLVCILQFLYTSSIRSWSCFNDGEGGDPKDVDIWSALAAWPLMFDVLRASTYFRVKSLTEEVFATLWRDMKSWQRSFHWLCLKISEVGVRLSLLRAMANSTDIEEDVKKDIDVFCLRLVSYLKLLFDDKIHMSKARSIQESSSCLALELDGFSQEAVTFCIANLSERKSDAKELTEGRFGSGQWSFDEYYKFIMVTCWCLSHAFIQCPENKCNLLGALPSLALSRSMVKGDTGVGSPGVEKFKSPWSTSTNDKEKKSGTWMQLLLEKKRGSEKVFRSLFAQVNLGLIHPHLFESVIVPMGIYSATEIQNASHIQAQMIKSIAHMKKMAAQISELESWKAAQGKKRRRGTS